MLPDDGALYATSRILFETGKYTIPVGSVYAVTPDGNIVVGPDTPEDVL